MKIRCDLRDIDAVKVVAEELIRILDPMPDLLTVEDAYSTTFDHGRRFLLSRDDYTVSLIFPIEYLEDSDSDSEALMIVASQLSHALGCRNGEYRSLATPIEEV